MPLRFASNETEKIQLDALARQALSHYRYSRDAWIDGDEAIERISFSENAVYRVLGQDSEDYILRLCQPGYNSMAEIMSEIEWIRALAGESSVSVPRVIEIADDQHVGVVAESGSRDEFAFVLFGCCPGVEPDFNEGPTVFQELGKITARMHEHALSWHPPAYFQRRRWDLDSMIGEHAAWGRWQSNDVVGSAEQVQLDQLLSRISNFLSSYARGANKVGLIHADLRSANLLVNEDSISVIDFDDCGYGFLLYDLGAALTGLERSAVLPELIDQWITGYSGIRPFDNSDRQAIAPIITVRLVQILGRIAGQGLDEQSAALLESIFRIGDSSELLT